MTIQKNSQKNGQILQNGQMRFLMASAVKIWPNFSKLAKWPNLATLRPTTLSRYSCEIRHTVYYVTVRSHTSSSSTNENQVYLCVPTEQRTLVVEGTRKILHFFSHRIKLRDLLLSAVTVLLH